MKKLEVKSLFSKRLIPLLIVPALLGSNFVSTQAFANVSDSLLESQEDTTGEDNANDQSETDQSDNGQSDNENSGEEGGEETTEETVEDETDASTEETTENPGENSNEEETEKEEVIEESTEDPSEETEDEEETEEEKLDDEKSEKEKQKKTEEDVSEKRTVVSREDFTIPVELVVEGDGDEDQIKVFVETTEGTEQLVQGEKLDVKVDGVEVVTTETEKTTTLRTVETTEDEESDEESEDDEETHDVEALLGAKTIASTDADIDADLNVEQESDEKIEKNTTTEETVEIVTKENETPQVSFGLSVNEEKTVIEKVTFNDEELSFADGYITLSDLDDLLVIDDDLDEEDINTLYILTSKLETTDTKKPEIEKVVIADAKGKDIKTEEDGSYVGNEVYVNIYASDDVSKEEGIEVTVTGTGFDETNSKAKYKNGMYVIKLTEAKTYTIDSIAAVDESKKASDAYKNKKTIRVNAKPKFVSTDLKTILVNTQFDEVNGEYHGKDVAVELEVEDDTPQGKIKVYFNDSEEFAATYDEESKKYVWKPDAKGFAYDISSITVDDGEGKKCTENVNFSIVEDDLTPTIIDGVELEGDSNFKNKWYSYESEYINDELTITIKGNSNVKVKSISVNGQSAVDAKNKRVTKYEFPFIWKKKISYDYSATINLNKVADKKYTEFPMIMYFEDGSKATGKVNVNINVDSTKPSADKTVVEVKRCDESKYKKLVKGETDQFCYNKDANLRVRIPKDAADISGLKKVEVVLNEVISCNDGTETKKNYSLVWESNPFHNPWKTEEGFLVMDSKTLDSYCDASVAYVVESVVLYDDATNYVVCDDFAGCNVVIDLKNPTITYTETSEASLQVPNYDYNGQKISFYNDKVTETITVSDYDVTADGVKIELVYEDGTRQVLTKDENGKQIIENPQGNIKSLTLNDKKNIVFNRNDNLTYKHTLEGTGEYQFFTTAVDKSGNKIEDYPSNLIVIDQTAPDVSIVLSCGEAKGKDVTYSNKDVEITAIVKEKWFNDKNSILIIHGVDENGQNVEVPLNSGENSSIWTFDEELGAYVAKATTSVDGVYSAEVKAYDLVGNEQSATTLEFTVDKTAPDISITFDNNDVKNGKYYNKTRTATISVKDFTFDSNNSPLELSETRGKASEEGWQNAGGNVYTKSVTFAQDGIYSFKFSSTDKALNSTTADPVAEFIIDCTDPKIAVYYTGGTAKNEMYYKAARTASIEIDEMSFDASAVEYTAQAIEEVSALPVLGAFTSSEDSNTAQITFDKDGKYGYVINCTDLAGNSCSSYVSDVFVIDTTVPEVAFSGVENFSANKGVVAPVVSYSDKYMDMNATTVKMVGANNGVITLGSQTTQTENGFVVSYSDFAHDKKNDDLYTFEATVVDLAGNETKSELVFSVNRFGSVFALGEATKALNEQYYTNEPQDIVITEINVDDLTYKDVSISRDGEITELKKDKDYDVTKQGSDTSWKTYTYTISKDNFKKDGVYSVTVYTEDRAKNIQDNKSRDAEVNFAIDGTKPSIVTAGIENGMTVYEKDSYDFNLDVTDNMMLKSLVVYDDKEVIATYDQDELLNNTDAKVITLKGSDLASTQRTITIEAEDVAGNKETIAYSGIIVSNAKPDVLDEHKEEGKTSNKNEDGENSSNLIVWIVVALGAVALAGGSGVVLYKKKAN